MMRSNLFIIAQSGWKYVGFSLSFFLVFMILDLEFLAFLSFLFALVSVFVFRNPERELLSFEEKSILSPVDGVVSAITQLDDSEYGYRIDVQSSYIDVSLLRAPINASVESLKYHKGTRTSKNSKLFETLNENVEIIFVNNNKQKVKVKHTLSQSFAPLNVDIINSQTLLKTSRYGVMLCGLTSIYLPSHVRVNVNLANEIKASQTLIGHL